MSPMTKLQRVMQTFEHKEVDRPAIYDKIHNVALIEHVTGTKLTAKNAEDVTCIALGKLCDMARHVAIPHRVDEYTQRDGDGFVYRIAWYTKDIMQRPFQSEEGACELVKRDIDTLNACIEKELYCPELSWHLQLFGEDLVYPEDLNNEFERIQEKMDGTIMVAPEFFDGIGPLSNRYDYTYFIYLLHDYPGLMAQLLDVYIDYQLFRIESFDSTLTPVALISTAIAGTSGLMYSPEFIRREYFPRMQRLHRRLKQKGYRVIVESDGDNRLIFEDFVRSGIEAYTPVERTSHMNIEEIKKKYPALVLCQEIDSTHLLPFGTREEVIEETKGVIEIADTYGGIFIGSCGDIHQNVKLENALAMYETVKQHHCT
jgi:hypothetical protein